MSLVVFFLNFSVLDGVCSSVHEASCATCARQDGPGATFVQSCLAAAEQRAWFSRPSPPRASVAMAGPRSRCDFAGTACISAQGASGCRRSFPLGGACSSFTGLGPLSALRRSASGWRYRWPPCPLDIGAWTRAIRLIAFDVDECVGRKPSAFAVAGRRTAG